MQEYVSRAVQERSKPSESATGFETNEGRRRATNALSQVKILGDLGEEAAQAVSPDIVLTWNVRCHKLDAELRCESS